MKDIHQGMTEEDKKEIDEIKSSIDCKKDFQRVDSGFENLCKTKEFGGVEGFTKCLESNSLSCKFAMSFGEGYLCKCPLRIHIKKRIGK